MIKHFIFVIIFINPIVVNSQENNIIPLAIGNKWLFEKHNKGWNPNGAFDYYEAVEYAIIDSLSVENKVFYIVKTTCIPENISTKESWYSNSKYFFRSFSVSYDFNTFKIIYDKTIKNDTTWSESNYGTTTYQIKNEKSTIFNINTNIQSRIRDWHSSDESDYSSTKFAEGIGIIFIYDSWTFPMAHSSRTLSLIGFKNNNHYYGKPHRPVGLKIINTNQSILSWRQNFEPNIIYYKIYNGTDSTNLSLYDHTSAIDDTSIIINSQGCFDTYFFSITAVNNQNVESNFSNIIKINPTDIIPSKIQLYQNHPNPFKLNTSIIYDLTSETFVKINIYNIHGQKIKTLLKEKQKQGRRIIIWNGTDDNNSIVSSGVYFLKLTEGNNCFIKRILFIK